MISAESAFPAENLLQVELVILNGNFTAELQNASSAAYRAFTRQFCAEVSHNTTEEIPSVVEIVCKLAGIGF